MYLGMESCLTSKQRISRSASVGIQVEDDTSNAEVKMLASAKTYDLLIDKG